MQESEAVSCCRGIGMQFLTVALRTPENAQLFYDVRNTDLMFSDATGPSAPPLFLALPPADPSIVLQRSNQQP